MNEAKVQESSLKRVKTRIATFALALVVAFSMAMTTPVSAFAVPVIGNGVTIDKTATPLNEDDQTTVTLSVDGSETTKDAYVVFVLDKSTSNDVRAEAKAMLEELNEQVSSGNSIYVSVIGFESKTQMFLDWTKLSSDNYKVIEEALDNKRSESGTNIALGLAAGAEKLEAANTDDAYKHLVLVSDGITYLWPGDKGNMTIYTELLSNGEESINAGNEMMKRHHPTDYDSFVAEMKDMNAWMNKYGSNIQGDIEEYQHVYEGGQFKADDQGLKEKCEYLEAGFEEGDYIPGEIASSHYGANEAAVYMAAKEWQSIASKYHAYAFADVTPSNAQNAADYPWGSNFMSGLGTLGGYSTKVDSSQVKGMFDQVKSSILYAIQDGTVTDVIGNNFDLVGLDTFKLSVGGNTYTGTVNEASGKVTFDNGNYEITYSNGSESEQFTWKINTPVVNGSDLKLTYDLKLVNKQTAAGNYTVPTNESAVLNYTSTDSGSGDLKFPVPTVTYTVEEAPVSPATPDNGNNNTNNNVNTGTVNVNTDSDGKATSLPKTSDNVLPFAAGLIALIVLAGSAGAVAWRKTH